MIKYKVTTLDRKSYPGEAFIETYNKNTTIKSRGPLGIFLFNRRKDADAYIDDGERRYLRILRVQPIGRGRKTFCCPAVYFENEITARTDNFLSLGLDKVKMDYCTSTSNCRFIKDISIWVCAPGTMTYPAVKVLD